MNLPTISSDGICNSILYENSIDALLNDVCFSNSSSCTINNSIISTFYYCFSVLINFFNRVNNNYPVLIFNKLSK